ncbi:conserved hypothetical protein [Trichinella spiralis]|uniref:hypothetical protein n=1 Tax=Trichinella spiralis TaxID=6334 RepID=UPI0001EFDFCF|nr:conserved hypothetical protein [Trichinella spiralis]
MINPTQIQAYFIHRRDRRKHAHAHQNTTHLIVLSGYLYTNLRRYGYGRQFSERVDCDISQWLPRQLHTFIRITSSLHFIDTVFVSAFQPSSVMRVGRRQQAADVPAAWWSRLRKARLQQTLWRGTASSGQSAPPVNSAFAPGDVPGTFVTPLPPLSGKAPPSRGRAFVFLARPTPRCRSGRSASHLHGGRRGTFVDTAAFSGDPSRARAHGRCALGLPGCIPATLRFLAPAGSQSACTIAAAALGRTGRSQASPPCSRERCCCAPA